MAAVVTAKAPLEVPAEVLAENGVQHRIGRGVDEGDDHHKHEELHGVKEGRRIPRLGYEGLVDESRL